MKVYKACIIRDTWTDGRKYLSAFIGRQGLHNLTIYYKIGEKALPKIKGSKIFVFKDEKRAIQWMRNFIVTKNFVVFEGEATNVKPAKRLVFSCSDDIADYAEEYWREYFRYGTRFYGTKRNQGFDNAPEGTYLCDSFTPTKVVYRRGDE